MPNSITQRLHQLMHRARSRDRETRPSNNATCGTSHHEVEFVKSPDGLTYIAPPYMVGVPVAQWNPPTKTPSTTQPGPSLHEPSCVFANPVLPGFNPEPSITRVADDFFLTTSTVEYFPGLPIYHSKDLLNWKLIGHALTKENQRSLDTVHPETAIRSPTLRHMNGIFYLAAYKWDRSPSSTDDTPRTFCVYSSKIWDESAWSNPVFFDRPGFGHDLFCDLDGKVYLTTTREVVETSEDVSSNSELSISEIDLATGRSIAAPVILQSNYSSNVVSYHIFRRDEYYYQLITGITEDSKQQSYVSRSKQGPFGPREPGPQNPLWLDGPDGEVQKTSHADIFEDAQGQWWAVFSGTRSRKPYDTGTKSVLGRETFLVTVHWEDNWPTFNGGKTISLVTSSHSEKLKGASSFVWSSDFSKSELERGWYQQYNTAEFSYSILSSERHLRMYGNIHNLSSPGSPALLLRKQTAFRQKWKVLLNFSPKESGAEAGVVVWFNNSSFCSVGIHLGEEGHRVVSITRPGDDGEIAKEVVQKLPKYDCLVGLDIDARDDGYYFSVSTQKDYDYVIGSIPSQFLVKSATNNTPFNGAMFGLYAFADREPCSDPADFGDVLMVDSDDLK